MPEAVNLSRQMKEKLPKEMLDFLCLARNIAMGKGESLYLVGGIVRDLMLSMTSYDIDLVLQGDAPALAEELAVKLGAKLTIHPQFGTATLNWHEWTIDLTTSREETYARPGALPTVKPGILRSDLFRRDFTVNAMAVSLSENSWGVLIDPYGGRRDLNQRLIRILHEKSFMDDATRIWRAVRYATRLDFTIEEETLKLLRRDTGFLDTISGDRIHYEIECVLKEALPEKALGYAYELGILQKVHPSLKAGKWLTDKFRKAKESTSPGKPPMGLYLALMTYRLKSDELEQFISFLRFEKGVTRTLREVNELKGTLSSLARPNLMPSRIYKLLHGYSAEAMRAALIASASARANERMKLYLDSLRFIKLSLTGDDLKKMGVQEGPRMKEILARLLEARLDGKVKDREEEERLVREIIQNPKG
ncbi:MAG: CCA tRNA nucleotidyltransferase [Chloroflexota bacterium]